MKRAAVLAIALTGGCGDGGGDGFPADARSTTPPVARACLEREGFSVVTARRQPSDRDAPDVELVVSGRAGAFLAFYDELARAEQLDPELRENAERFDGDVERIDRVTIIFTKKPSDAVRDAVRGCVVQ